VGDFDLVKQLASKHTQLSEFLEEYVLDPVSISEIERQSQDDVVTLITIHSAKGTEQKVCYVANVSQDNIHMHVRKVILMKLKKSVVYFMWL
jgi:DNA helicase-2/ATP-dependent DNA helicase PcrA